MRILAGIMGRHYGPALWGGLWVGDATDDATIKASRFPAISGLLNA